MWSVNGSLEVIPQSENVAFGLLKKNREMFINVHCPFVNTEPRRCHGGEKKTNDVHILLNQEHKLLNQEHKWSHLCVQMT